MEEKWEVCILGEQDRRACRKLWETVFIEDSAGFLDYYDAYKALGNECYGIYDREGELASMLQLNPYRMYVNGFTAMSRYVIAVATRPEYRHKGLMRRLLVKSLKDMYDKGLPFAFLMPASEAIYRPFDFRYFYRTNSGRIWGKGSGKGADVLSVRKADKRDIPSMADFSSGILAEGFDCYPERDNTYYQTLLAETESEGGGILLLEEKTGEMKACVPFWGKEPVEIREILCRQEDGSLVLEALRGYFDGEVTVNGSSFTMNEQRPVIMGRITNVESFLKLFTSEYPVELHMLVTDPLISVNEGYYIWKLSPGGSQVRRTKKPDLSVGRRWMRCGTQGLFEWLTGGRGLTELLAEQAIRFGGLPEKEEGELQAAEVVWSSGETAGAKTEVEKWKADLLAVRVCRSPFINEIV
ncbi:GNAT family N-acetyltransferase [Qiania dongpingensis]|uniref:GNAT family N-acetyltransferase n=1 Tax=Qiania dongpingensis TaxID=2763669 RepID=A0A7G9G0N0_9FIRM|nr:GNAT family N-acetyltransferase [Qiania dongpingensis]QNM04362.1 GNAT family N-acetyltransferase [Qiania dongpingensis]